MIWPNCLIALIKISQTIALSIRVGRHVNTWWYLGTVYNNPMQIYKFNILCPYVFEQAKVNKLMNNSTFLSIPLFQINIPLFRCDVIVYDAHTCVRFFKHTGYNMWSCHSDLIPGWLSHCFAYYTCNSRRHFFAT